MVRSPFLLDLLPPDGSSAAAMSASALVASSAAFLFSVSLAMSTLACSITLLASAIVCSGLSVVPEVVGDVAAVAGVVGEEDIVEASHSS